MRTSLVTFLISCILLAYAQNEADDSLNTTTISATEGSAALSSSTLFPFINDYEYVTKLSYTLNKENVPEYIKNIIYDSMVQYGIKMTDLIELFNLDKYSLEETRQLLDTLNISRSQLFSLDGLESALNFVNEPFDNFYNDLKQNLKASGDTMTRALETLQINVTEFGISMVTNRPKPFDVVKQGNFTEETFNKTLAVLGTTQERFFEVVRDIFISEAVLLNSSYTKEKLDYFRSATGNDLWATLNVSADDILKVEIFDNILNNLTTELNRDEHIAVVTRPNVLTINKIIFDRWGYARNVLHIQGTSVFNNTVKHLVTKVRKGETMNSFELLSNINVTSFIKIAEKQRKAGNCSYISLWRNNLTSEELPMQLCDKTSYVILKSQITRFTLGGPLICDKELYGLARMETDTEIYFDALSEDVEVNTEPVGDSSEVLRNNLIVTFPVLLFIILEL